MAELTQNSYFGDVPDRLQKSLELDGIIRLKLQDALQPTILVADGTRPGYSGGVRQRRFSRGFVGLAAGSAYYLMAPVGTEGFEIETVQYVGTGSASPNGDIIQVYQYAPGIVAFPFTPATADIEFTDRFAGEVAPILTGSSAAAQTKTTTLNLPCCINTTVIPLPMFIPPGNMVVFRWVAAGGSLTLKVDGRTF